MIKFLKTVIVIFLFSTLTANAQDNKHAFKDGEKLRYIASYKIGFINVDVATIDFSVKREIRDSIDSYKINAVGEVLKEYNWFFSLRDDYYVWLDYGTLKPFYFENFIQEGDYTLESTYKYDWSSMKVKTYVNRPVWSAPKNRELDLNSNSLDGLSLFFNLRNLPIEDMEIGVPKSLDVVFANRIRHVEYRYMGKDKIRIRGFGKVNALKIVCQLANDSGVSFDDGDEFELWLSDDANRIPLYIDTPIKVGSVRARLANYKNLVAPFENTRHK